MLIPSRGPHPFPPSSARPVRPVRARCGRAVRRRGDGVVNTGGVVGVDVREVGPDALLVEVAGTEEALSLAAHLRSRQVAAEEVVPGARTVLLDGVTDRAAVTALLAGWAPGPPATPGPLVELPTTYDGADLDEVAEAWGTDRAGVVERHQAVEFVAAFCGFSPGFAYLGGLPAGLAVARRATPRTRVPAGAVALAGPWCAVYPTASPGGWRLLGRTDARLWDVTRPDPALLVPGVRVRFVAR
jgi:KipI family sensor histidine kinase inhibitor